MANLVDKNIDTFLQHIGQAELDPVSGTGPVALPSMRTSTVRFANMQAHDAAQQAKQRGERVATYGRLGLQTHAALEQLLCQLEGGQRAFLAPSGMAAISMALLAYLSQGQHALVVDNVYGPVRYFHKNVLARMGIDVDFVAPDVASLQAAIRPQTKLLYLESPGSLLMQMLDIPALATWAHAQGLLVMCDNTWGAGGYIYQPLQLGVDIAISAGTKYLGGHSDLMMGAAVVGAGVDTQPLSTAHNALGSTISADDAWLAIRGARTMALRLQACAANALHVCEWLDAQPEVSQVFFPAWCKDWSHALWRRDATGSNGLLAVATDFNQEQARRLVDSLELFSIGYSWGGYESLVSMLDPQTLAGHSYWRAHAGERMRAGTVLRLHVGLENPTDLIADLRQAFAAAQAG